MAARLAKALLLLLTASMSATASATCDSPIRVGELLNTWKSHQGKPICAVGILTIQFEGNQLAHSNNYMSLPARQAVWLDFYEGPNYTEASVARDEKRMNAWKEKLQGHCVFLEGTFDAEDTGHFGMWPAAIKDIQSISPAPTVLCGQDKAFKAKHQPLRGYLRP